MRTKSVAIKIKNLFKKLEFFSKTQCTPFNRFPNNACRVLIEYCAQKSHVLNKNQIRRF